MVQKKLIPVLFVIASLLFSACFTPWEGDGATLSIHLNGGPSRAALWGEHVNFMSHLEHRIRLEGPGGVINRVLKPGELRAEFRLAPGNWSISVEGYLFGELYSSFTSSIGLSSGNNSVSMPMIWDYDPDRFDPAAAAQNLFAFNSATGTITGTGADMPGFLSGNGGRLVIPQILGGARVINIGNNAINSNAGITHLTIPGSVTSLGEGAFQQNANLSSVIIGNGLTEIPVDAFYAHINLKNLTIGENVTIIRGGAFQHHGFENLVIPANVKTIEGHAFIQNASNIGPQTLRSVTFMGDISLVSYFMGPTEIQQVFTTSTEEVIFYTGGSVFANNSFGHQGLWTLYSSENGGAGIYRYQTNPANPGSPARSWQRVGPPPGH